MRSRHCKCEFFQWMPLKVILGRHEKAFGARARRPAFIEHYISAYEDRMVVFCASPPLVKWTRAFFMFCKATIDNH
ncbi:hypothetical protein GY31_15680 [Lysinibacillus sphaericus]|nr:hypothetical protein GY31_15680 [Lysinibacillus sphaericus]